MRILYIHHNAVPPSLDPRKNWFLATGLECDILQPIWFDTPEEVESLFGTGSYPTYSVGGIRYHWLLRGNHIGWMQRMSSAFFYVSRGISIYRKTPFACIITYSHMLTGVSGALLKVLTAAKLIVEIVTSPHVSYLALRPCPSLADRLMQKLSDVLLHISLWSCDTAHLLGPRLISYFPRLKHVRTAVFPAYVPVSQVPFRSQSADQYIILVGAPWYLKGADILIKAFIGLASDFPQVKLKLLGWFPDRDRLASLAKGSTQIELLDPRPNVEVLSIVSQALLLALPSRCEGTPCVILEAMAAGLPIVASDVGGIPELVRDGQNGFLVPVGDTAVLEDRLRRLLSDSDLRVRMGNRSYEMAHQKFDEASYAGHFVDMVKETVER